MENPSKHWTDESPMRFKLCLMYNFLAGVEQRLEELCLTKKKLAEKLGVPPRQVNRLWDNPDKITLHHIITWCRVLGLKPAIVVYEDDSIPSRQAPVHPEVFLASWKRLGCPVDNSPFVKEEDDNPANLTT